MCKQPFFVVADKVEQETIYYKIPKALKECYEMYKVLKKQDGNYSFNEFNSIAADWWYDFPEGLKILKEVKPILIDSAWGFRLPGYELHISKS